MTPNAEHPSRQPHADALASSVIVVTALTGILAWLLRADDLNGTIDPAR